jgi:uncharacterized phage protein (TIGR02220 family)
MNILQLLSSNSYLTVNKVLAKKVGLEASVLFADLAGSQLYWDSQNKTDNEGWFFRTQKDIEEQTTLSPKVQTKCIKILIVNGLVQTKLKGLPAVTHYLIGELEVTNLLNLFSQKGESSLAKREKLVSTKGSTIKNINNKNINNENIIIEEESVISSDSEIESVKYYFETNQIIELLTEKTGAKYKIPKTKSLLLRYGVYKLIKERFEDGAILEDFVNVIEYKYNEWINTKFISYLVPDTLFRKSNFEKYLTQIQIKPISNNTNNLIDDNGNYAKTDEGRKLFHANVAKGAADAIRAIRNGERDDFWLRISNAKPE